MKKDIEEGPVAKDGEQAVEKPVSPTNAIWNIISRFCDVGINLLLYSTFVNPSVPHFLYWVAAAAGVGYALFSGPLSQDGNASFAWDSERKVLRTLNWRKAEYTRTGFAFMSLHLLLRAVGSFWLLYHCVNVAHTR